MIKHGWSVICQASIVDKDTNLFSIINVIEGVAIQGEQSADKIFPLPIQVASFWYRENNDIPAKGQARNRFISPSGEIIKEQEMEIDLETYERFRWRSNFVGLNFLDGSGIYTVAVSYRSGESEEWTDVASVPLKVEFESGDE
jgi:hypothetical protein